MKIRPAILIIENDKVLTMQYRYGNEDVYNLPGGNVELGESLIQTLEREMQEELGIKVAVGNLVLVGEVHSGGEPHSQKNSQVLHCIFRGKNLEGKPKLNPKETSAKNIKWLTINELSSKNMYPNIGEAIQKLLAGELQNLYLGKIFQNWF
jgi:8-oxo-dGTP diphosphatase